MFKRLVLTNVHNSLIIFILCLNNDDEFFDNDILNDLPINE